MQIRFLVTTPSSSPSFPFQAGQIIDVPQLSPAMRQWLREARIELIAETLDAAMIAPPAERATLRRATARGGHAA